MLNWSACKNWIQIKRADAKMYPCSLFALAVGSLIYALLLSISAELPIVLLMLSDLKMAEVRYYFFVF